MLKAIWNVLLLSVVIFGVARFLPGVHLKDFKTAVIVAVVYSIINFLAFKLLLILSFPAVVVSFGLFIFIINAVLLWATDKIIDDFEIDSFWMTVVAALIITIFNNFFQWVF